MVDCFTLEELPRIYREKQNSLTGAALPHII